MATKVVGFKIEILGTKEQVTALRGIQTEIVNLTKANMKLAKEGKKNTKAFQENDIALKALRIEHRQTQATIEKTASGSRKLGNSYNDLTARNRQLSAAAKQLLDPLGKDKKEFDRLSGAVRRNEGTLKKLDSAMGRSQRNVGNYQGAIKGLGGGLLKLGLALGAGLIGVQALAAGIRNTAEVVANFEKANSELEAVLQGTNEEMRLLSDSAKELGATTAFTATEVTELNISLAKLGFPTEDILEMNAAILDGASAMGSELGATATLVGATLKAFGLDASETGRVVDVLAKSTSVSALDFEKLNSSMSTIAPVAKKFGFSLEATVSLLGELSNAGFDASSAATATRNILLNLADSNGKLAKSLKEPVKDLPSLVAGLKQLKNEGTDLGEALELTDKRSVAAFATFLDGADDVLELNRSLEAAGGTADRMADTQLDNLTGRLTILNSTWEGFILSLDDGEGLISGSLKTGIERLTILLGKLSGDTNSLKEDTLDLFRANNELIPSAQELSDRYDDLSVNANLTSEEKRELNSVTNDLVKIFGSSISQINKETGALEINRGELLRQIKVRAALRSEQAQSLIAEQLRLETTIKSISVLEKQFNLLEEEAANPLTGSLSLLESGLVNLATQVRSGEISLQEFSKQLTLIEIGTQDLTATQEQNISIISAYTFSTDRLSVAQNRLEDIQNELLAAGIDLDELTERTITSINTQTGSTDKNTKAKKDNAKATKDLNKAEQFLDKLRESNRNQQIKDQEAFEKRRNEADDRFIKNNIDNFKGSLRDKQDLLNESFENELITRQAFEEQTKIIEEERTERAELAVQGAIQGAQILSDTIFQLESQALDRRTKRDLRAAQNTADTELTILKEQLRDGLISETQFREAKQELDRKDEQRKRRILRKQFAEQKTASLVQAAINTALAVTAALTQSPPASYVLAAISAAAGAAQIAVIAASQFAKGGELFPSKQGGMIQGASHAQGGVAFNVGGTPHEAEGGEAIINRNSTQRFKPLLSAINQAGGGVPFARGGIPQYQTGIAVPSPAALTSPRFQPQADDIIESAQEAAGAIIVQLVESDVTGIQNSVQVTEEQGTI